MLVRCFGDKASLDEIRGPRRRLVSPGQPAALGLTLRALQAVLAHHALHPPAADFDAAAAQRLPCATRAIGGVVVGVDVADAPRQRASSTALRDGGGERRA